MAFKWFKKAAEQEHPQAQFNLGVIFAEGEGVPQNNIKAYAWTSLSFANGLELAKKNLFVLNKIMTASEIQKAVKEATKLRASFKKINNNAN